MKDRKIVKGFIPKVSKNEEKNDLLRRSLVTLGKISSSLEEIAILMNRQVSGIVQVDAALGKFLNEGKNLLVKKKERILKSKV